MAGIPITGVKKVQGIAISPQGGRGTTLQGSSGNLQGSSSGLQGSSLNIGNVNPMNYVGMGGAQQAPSNQQAVIGGGGGGYVGPSAAQVDPILASMRELDGILANRNAEAQAEYQRAMDSYNEQDALDRAARDKNKFQNENTFTSNNHAALLNAANASTGLRGVLASLGGLAGSGLDVVSRLTGLAANQDAGAAKQTFEVNADNLNTAWSQAEREQRQRRRDADATFENAKRNNEAQILNSRQGMLQSLADLYGADSAQGRTYASEAASLASPIARTTRATVAPYAKASSLYSPGALQEYLAGTQDLNVSSSASPQATAIPANSPIFGTGRRKDQLPGVA